MRVAILLAYESNPYEGRVRPFINWAKELSKEYEVCFYLYRCNKKVIEFIKNMSSIHSKNIRNLDELIDHLNKIKPNVFFLDDYPYKLKWASKIKDKIGNIKTLVYVQILFATHSIMEVFDNRYLPIKEKFMFKLSRCIPFNLLKRQYKMLLKKQDIIVANSEITATLLHILYGVEPHGAVYPPLDTNVFKPKNVKKKNQVLLYLGSNAGDTDENFVREICKVIKAKDFKILAIGNKNIMKKLQREFQIQPISGVSDEELARIYSESKLTICPQKWEQFGYVPVESMACGTPVLAFGYMGFSETIIDGKTGWLAINNQEFLEKLNSVLENNKQIDMIFIREHVVKMFSAKRSANKLLKIIEGVHNYE